MQCIIGNNRDSAEGLTIVRKDAQERALRKAEAAKEKWLREEGVARYDAFHRDPSRASPAAEVFARLRAHNAKQERQR